jgi:hypothetical protein
MLTLLITGKPAELHPFLFDLTTQPQYHVQLQSVEQSPSPVQEAKVEARIHFAPTHRKPLHITLITDTDEQIHIHFVDGRAVKMDETFTFISGKVFDIFG